MSFPERVYRVGVLSVVKHDYLPRAVAAHPRFRLVVVADEAAQPEWVHARNQLFADEIGVPYVRDVGRALGQYDLDVAVVSSQAERHVELGLKAVEAGLHLIQDKPMSNRLEACERLVEAVRRRGVKSLIWNRNFVPAMLQAAEIVERGSLGELYAMHCDFYFAKDSGPPVGSREKGGAAIDWLERQIEAHADGSDGAVGEEPMGELKNEGIYPLAHMRMLGRAAVRRVFARSACHFHQVNRDHGVEDLATVTLEMDRGLVGSLCLGRIGAASHPDLGEIKLHLLGTRGALVISEPRPEVAVYYRGQPPQEFRHRRLADNGNFLLMENFLRAMEQGGETILDAVGGRDICAVVEAALESCRSGRVVEVG